jgi:hypothetical protein
MDINSSAYLKASRALQAAAKSAAEDVSNKSGASPVTVPRCEPCSTSVNHHFTPCPSPAKVIISWSSSLNFLIFFISEVSRFSCCDRSYFLPFIFYSRVLIIILFVLCTLQAAGKASGDAEATTTGSSLVHPDSCFLLEGV